MIKKNVKNETTFLKGEKQNKNPVKTNFFFVFEKEKKN